MNVHDKWVIVPGRPVQPSLMFVGKSNGLYYKHITTINDNSSTINKFEASLTDDARVIIYDRHMFIVQATGGNIRVEHPKGSSLR
jgi:hypothetical protein